MTGEFDSCMVCTLASEVHTSNGMQHLPILPAASGLRKNGIRRTLTDELPAQLFENGVNE